MLKKWPFLPSYQLCHAHVLPLCEIATIISVPSMQEQSKKGEGGRCTRARQDSLFYIICFI